MAEIRNLTRNGETFYPLTHEKAVIGMEDFKDTITEQIDNYRPIEITGDVTNAPDEEDITSDSNNLLKFKNRNNLYGLGKIILRRGSSFASQVIQANTIYVIQYNFDLDSGRVNIPNGSILMFEGGTLSNGTLVCADLYDVRLVYYQDVTEILSSVTLEGNFIHKACDKDTIRQILVDNQSITKDVNDVLSVKEGGIQNIHLNGSVVDNSTVSLDTNNKISIKDGGVTGNKLNSGIVNTDDLSIVNNKIQIANRGTTNGMGKIILRKDQSFASQLTQQNTIYVIRYDFTLTGDITIPANCVLEFDGGSISGGYTINFNKCGIEASKGNTIFGETLNIKGLQYAHASWLGIVPAAVGSDSGSSKFIHFCSSSDCDGFELEFDRARYTFALHGVLLNKWMKLKGAPDRSTEWFVTIDDSCDYVIGVNRHCSVSNLNIRLASADNETGVDFFRVSNSWSDTQDAADSMKLNYDYSFDTIWIKGTWKQDGDYSTSMNGIAIRLRDREVGASVDNKVLYAAGPQHCDNIMIEMVRAGIVFEVTNTSSSNDKVWANGFSFTNLFIQGEYGYEQILSANTGSSGACYICNFQYQGKPGTVGGFALYGQLNRTKVVNLESHDTYNKIGCGSGIVQLANCSFSDDGSYSYTDLKNGFLPLNGSYPEVRTIPYKVNEIVLVPTNSKPSDGVYYHRLDYSEVLKRTWRTRNDHPQYKEETLKQFEYSKKIVITSANNSIEDVFKDNSVISTLNNPGISKNLITYWKKYISGYSVYQDGAYIKAYSDYGFKISISRVSSSSFKIGDVLMFTYTFGIASGVEGTLADKLLYIKNLYCTAGEVNINSIIASASNIVVTGNIRVKKTGSLANDGIGLEYKILEKSNAFTDEKETMWAKEQITENLSIELLYHTIGTTSERPTSELYVGMQYFDTSTGIEKPIWYKGNNVWIDATGNPV